MFDFLMSEEQLALREEARGLVRWVPKQLVLDMDADKVRFPVEFVQEAARRGLFGCRYPKSLGGKEMGWDTSCMLMEEVGTVGYMFACLYGTGPELVCDAIVKHGNDDQKERYVRPLLAGKLRAAECLTEPRGGSDFFGTTMTAEDAGDHFVLNGQKRFIVGAEGADYFLVYARTNADPKADPHKALTCFIVDRGPGVEVKYLYGLLGCRGGGTGRMVFRDVKVPKANVLRGVGEAYPVFNTMMIPERLGTSAMTIGAARPALDIATAYSMRRKAFGQTINQFQGVSFQIAEASMLLDVARSMVYTTARAADSGIDPHRVRRMVSETKRFVTESCQKVVHNSMQVVGGISYTNVFPLERIYRDLRLASIWTGTNEVMAAVIGHEWYREFAKDTVRPAHRDYEADAEAADVEGEKIYE